MTKLPLVININKTVSYWDLCEKKIKKTPKIKGKLKKYNPTIPEKNINIKTLSSLLQI